MQEVHGVVVAQVVMQIGVALVFSQFSYLWHWWHEKRKLLLCLVVFRCRALRLAKGRSLTRLLAGCEWAACLQVLVDLQSSRVSRAAPKDTQVPIFIHPEVVWSEVFGFSVLFSQMKYLRNASGECGRTVQLLPNWQHSAGMHALIMTTFHTNTHRYISSAVYQAWVAGDCYKLS